MPACGMVRRIIGKTTGVTEMQAGGARVRGNGAARAGHSVELESITHRFGATTAVADVSLAVEAGELVALLGPSGCGKTTLLRIIGGFIVPTAGGGRVDGRPIHHLPLNRPALGH